MNTKVLNKNIIIERDFIPLRNLAIEDYDMLKDLLKFESVSGKESKVALYIKEYLVDLGFEVRKDSKGNIYAVRGIAKEYAMLNAHMDIVNLANRYSSFYNKTKTTTSKKAQEYNALMVDSFDYSIRQEIEKIKATKMSTMPKEIEVSDEEAEKIWLENKKDRELLYGADFKEIGFKCTHCVNSCKAYKLCYYFQPNSDLDTKKQYAKYMKMLMQEDTKVQDGFVQESFDLTDKIVPLKSNNFINTKSEKSSSKEKYLITVDLVDDKISGSGKNRVLGGDDKCGIFIALKVAEMLRNMPMKILFTVEEETGCNGVKHFVKHNAEWLEDVKYSITIDRKDSCHLLWSQRGTRSCSDEFAAELMYHGIREGIPVKLEDGGSADVVILRDYVPNAVNMSAGYYKAHTSSEYIVPSEVDKIVGWVRNIVKYV